VLNEADLPKIEQAVAAQPDRALHETLIDRGFAREEPVLRALAEEFGLELIDLAAVELDPAALTAVPLKLIHRRNLMPLARENGTLTVATGNPYDVYALDELQTVTGLEILPVLASPREITRLIRTHFGVGGETVSALMEEKADRKSGE